MSHAADLTAREAEIICILRALGPHVGKFVVVGGYAVNALTSHRFSVDCDMVVAEKDVKLFDDLLKKEGYTKQSDSLTTSRQLSLVHILRGW